MLLSILLGASLGGAAFLGKLWTDEKTKLLQSEQSFKSISRRLSEMETRNSELSSLLTDKQAEIERLRDEWTNQVSTMEKDHKDQLQRTFAQMNEIVYDSKKTLTYISDVETRLRQGQRIDEQEARKLAAVVNGLSFLHEQYKKPIAEFRELDRYFQKQLDNIPQSTTPVTAPPPAAPRAVPVSQTSSSPLAIATPPDPAKTTNILKKIFNNKKYKEEREAFIEEKGRSIGVAQGMEVGQKEGKRQALTDAKQKVKQAYTRAQAQMSALELDKTKYLAQLDQLVGSNQKSAEEVEDFFTKSKEILKIHDQIMNIEPTKVPEIQP